MTKCNQLILLPFQGLKQVQYNAFIYIRAVMVNHHGGATVGGCDKYFSFKFVAEPCSRQRCRLISYHCTDVLIEFVLCGNGKFSQLADVLDAVL